MVDGISAPALAEVGTVVRRAPGALGGRCVIVDIDGVLADASWRQHLLDTPGRRRNWDAFFDAAADDPPLHAAITALARFDHDTQVVLVTGRPARLAELTAGWLDRHGARWDLLVLRRGGDHRPAPQFKVRVLEALRGAEFEVLAAFDDDAGVLDAYRSHGLVDVSVTPASPAEKPLK